MTEPPPDNEASDGPDVPDPGASPARRPAWQKAVRVLGLLVLLGLAVLLVTGDHGPARHAPEGTANQDSDFEEEHDPSQWDL